jgi:choline dehydrogenase-like flavoprotein
VPPSDNSSYRTSDPFLYDPTAGPGHLGYTNFNPPSIGAFVESLPSIDIPISFDLNSGNNIGGKHELNTLNPILQTRVSSYSAFWETVSTKSSFEAITYAVVEKILFSTRQGSEQPVAVGASYSTTVNGQKVTRNVYADKEVILSAGTLQTPQLLMLSVRILTASLHSS